jgi:hypothetical protein
MEILRIGFPQQGILYTSKKLLQTKNSTQYKGNMNWAKRPPKASRVFIGIPNNILYLLKIIATL